MVLESKDEQLVFKTLIGLRNAPLNCIFSKDKLIILTNSTSDRLQVFSISDSFKLLDRDPFQNTILNLNLIESEQEEEDNLRKWATWNPETDKNYGVTRAQGLIINRE